MTYTMERILAWKLLPRAVMAVMLYMYVEVLYWFMALPQDEVSTQATALTATVTGAISGAFGLWLGNEKS
jgi:Tfp pilus assembly protein PilO